jgi:hypothetical protein
MQQRIKIDKANHNQQTIKDDFVKKPIGKFHPKDLPGQ